MPIWKSIVQNLIRSWKLRDHTVEVAKAWDLLGQVGTLLDKSQKTLVSIKPALAKEEVDMFEGKHHQLYLALVIIRTDVREKQERDDFFSSPEEKTEFYTEVQKLLRQCQSYHRDVLYFLLEDAPLKSPRSQTTSQRAHLNEAMLQFKDTISPASSAQPTPWSSLNPSWVAIAPSVGSSGDYFLLPPDPDGETLGQLVGPSGGADPGASGCSNITSLLLYKELSRCNAGLPYFANIVHIPQSASATEQELLSGHPGGGHYHRLVVYGNRQKRVVVYDPNPHPTKRDDPEDDAERSPDEFLQIGDMLMTSDPQNFEDHAITSTSQGSSLVTSILSMWSLNPDSLRLGGMV
ncbi:hypothetical protein FRC11_005210 [Ceratobasidium sp. 423]|nr:hypothetical protein FRC11_005210 [Ceratobasidium sp. 423]